MSFEELLKINNHLLGNLKKIYKQEKHATLRDFIKASFKEWESVYYFSASKPIFRISRKWEEVLLADEVEKIELLATPEDISSIHNLLKDDKKVEKAMKNTQSIKQILGDLYKTGKFETINGKPYIIYDIETTFTSEDITTHKFILGYYILSNDKKQGNFRYIGPEDLKKFVTMMLEFDGYIIWYNNISFDNPVSAYNVGLGEQEIKILNNKTLDVFAFLRNTTGKRMGLNKVSSALVGIWKTLESWAQGDQLLKKYEETWDISYFNTFKDYCKNDVKITMLVLFYLLNFQKLHIDEEEITYDLQDFLEQSTRLKSDKSQPNQQPSVSMFDA